MYEADKHPENLEIEGTEKVKEENKRCYILSHEFEKALKDMKNGKAVGVDEIPIELIKNMSEESKTELNNIYTSGERPQDYLETILIPLQKKIIEPSVSYLIQCYTEQKITCPDSCCSVYQFSL